MELKEIINNLKQGDILVIESHYIHEHSTRPLPERGEYNGKYFTQSERHPVWLRILQTRNAGPCELTFPLSNIKSIEVIKNDMSNKQLARTLQQGQFITITISEKNTSGHFKDFRGRFVRLEEKGKNYKVIISINTGFSHLTGKEHIEEKAFWGQSIHKIRAY